MIVTGDEVCGMGDVHSAKDRQRQRDPDTFHGAHSALGSPRLIYRRNDSFGTMFAVVSGVVRCLASPVASFVPMNDPAGNERHGQPGQCDAGQNDVVALEKAVAEVHGAAGEWELHDRQGPEVGRR